MGSVELNAMKPGKVQGISYQNVNLSSSTEYIDGVSTKAPAWPESNCKNRNTTFDENVYSELNDAAPPPPSSSRPQSLPKSRQRCISANTLMVVCCFVLCGTLSSLLYFHDHVLQKKYEEKCQIETSIFRQEILTLVNEVAELRSLVNINNNTLTRDTYGKTTITSPTIMTPSFKTPSTSMPGYTSVTMQASPAAITPPFTKNVSISCKVKVKVNSSSQDDGTTPISGIEAVAASTPNAGVEFVTSIVIKKMAASGGEEEVEVEPIAAINVHKAAHLLAHGLNNTHVTGSLDKTNGGVLGHLKVHLGSPTSTDSGKYLCDVIGVYRSRHSLVTQDLELGLVMPTLSHVVERIQEMERETEINGKRLRDQLSHLDGLINFNKQKIVTLGNRAEITDTLIASLNYSIITSIGSISTLERGIDSNKDKVSTLQNKVNTTKTELHKLGANINITEGQIFRLNQSVNTNNDKISNLETNLNTTKAKIRSFILERRIESNNSASSSVRNTSSRTTTNEPSTTTVTPDGWTVIQRRATGDVDFYRRWSDYEEGFGDVSGDYWIGLENIHNLCPRTEPCALHIAIKDDNNTKESLKGRLLVARYSSFAVGNSSDNYRLYIYGHNSSSSTAGDPLTQKNNLMEFSTRDRDNDKARLNCAMATKGGWWFNSCGFTNLNGRWGQRGQSGLSWLVTSTMVYATFTEIKVKASGNKMSSISEEGIMEANTNNVASVSSGAQNRTSTITKEPITTTGAPHDGWTIIQKRATGDVDFHRNWSDYEAGFGDVSGDHWIGLKSILDMCPRTKPCALHIAVKDDNNTKESLKGRLLVAEYSSFSLGNSSDYYRLYISGHNSTSSTAGDSMTKTHNLMKFTTYDWDNDAARTFNCGSGPWLGGGWWYNKCGFANLNGGWGHRGNAGLSWRVGFGKTLYATFTEIKVKVKPPS